MLNVFLYRQEILERRMAKRQRRQDMAKRRTAAAQERMRIISQLARKEKRDDDFGMRDEDWDVYKVINRVRIDIFFFNFKYISKFYNVSNFYIFYVGRWRLRFRSRTRKTYGIGRCVTTS